MNYEGLQVLASIFFFLWKDFPNSQPCLGCLPPMLPTLWSCHRPCAFIRLLPHWLVMSRSWACLSSPCRPHEMAEAVSTCLTVVPPAFCPMPGTYVLLTEWWRQWMTMWFSLSGTSDSLRIVLSWSSGHLSETGWIDFFLVKNRKLKEVNWLQLNPQSKHKSVLY